MSSFRFKRFAVEQDGAAMKVGTDGVLLGAWFSVRGDERRILDIGTGTGVIALMAAQRTPAESIVAVDIDRPSAECAAGNFRNSPWAGRLRAECAAVQDFDDGTFDLILSNPPYFVDSLLPDKAGRIVSRHTEMLSIRQLGESICRLLSPDGRCAVILPPQQMEELCASVPLHVVRRCSVRTVPGGPVKRVMAELSRVPSDMEVSELVIETDVRGRFSDEYRRLTCDFYLKF